jgi:hypothetical protein
LKRNCPRTDNPEPSLTKALVLKEEPMFMKSKTESALPHLAKLLKLQLEPRRAWLKMDVREATLTAPATLIPLDNRATARIDRLEPSEAVQRTDCTAPNLECDLIENELPTLPHPNRDMAAPRRTCEPRIDIELPILMKLRRLILEPPCMATKAEQLEPSLTNERTDRALAHCVPAMTLQCWQEPKRNQPMREALEPILAKARTLTLLPTLPDSKTLMAAPSLANDPRMDSDDPMLAYSKTLCAAPTRAKLRTEMLDPKQPAPKIDMPPPTRKVERMDTDDPTAPNLTTESLDKDPMHMRPATEKLEPQRA